jgi:hypothetical protein
MLPRSYWRKRTGQPCVGGARIRLRLCPPPMPLGGILRIYRALLRCPAPESSNGDTRPCRTQSSLVRSASTRRCLETGRRTTRPSRMLDLFRGSTVRDLRGAPEPHSQPRHQRESGLSIDGRFDGRARRRARDRHADGKTEGSRRPLIPAKGSLSRENVRCQSCFRSPVAIAVSLVSRLHSRRPAHGILGPCSRQNGGRKSGRKDRPKIHATKRNFRV